MSANNPKGGWDGYEKRGKTASGLDQCSAPREFPHKSNGAGGDAVKAQDKSTAPRSFNKGGGGGADAVQSQGKTEAPRSFTGGGYDGSQPCENQLNKRPNKM